MKYNLQTGRVKRGRLATTRWKRTLRNTAGSLRSRLRASAGSVAVRINPMYGKTSKQFGLAEKYFSQHAYSQLYAFVAGAAGVFGTEQNWSLNDMFDPDFTGVGHQPYLRDQVAFLYGKYKVLGVKIELIASDPTADGVVLGVRINTPSDAGVLAGATPSTMGEKSNVQLKYLNNTGSQVVVWKKYYKMWQIAGVTKLQYDADYTNYSAAVGSSPTLIPSLHIAIAGIDGASTPTARIMQRFTFYCQWTERQTVAQS